MTITLKVDDKVREALQQDFPGYNTERALKKYLGLLEKLIFDGLQHGQTPEQRKLKLFSLSTHELAQKGGAIGPAKIRVHKWLTDKGLALVEPVIKGSNISGMLSQCKLTPLVSLENRLSMPANINIEEMTDQEIDMFLDGSEEEREEIIRTTYPDLTGPNMREQFLRHYDFVEINIQSLKAYIEWLLTEAKLYNAQKKETALRQARIILAVALQLDGKFLQRKKPSPFGRLYYQGISVQSVNKDLRRAMLGHCWCYDIRSSVIAWKMGFARCYRAEVEPNANFRKLFSSTLVYLEDKNDFMVEVRRYTFNSDSNCETELQKKIIKRALTAISFGARASAKGWLDSDGQVRNPALVDIIKNKDERARFLNCDAIRSFIHEQKTLDDYIYKLVQKERPDLLKLDCLKTQSGRPSKAKVLAYLYQHSETQVMAIVTRLAEEHKKKVLAQIHDAVIVRPRFGLDLKCEILEQMQQETDNPYWRLALEELFPFKRRSRDEERELLAHRQRIREAEARAKLYAQGLLSLEQAIKL